MNALLEKLREASVTLTVYNYDGDAEELEAIAASLSGVGVAVTTDTTGRGTPTNLGVFHRDEEVLGALSIDDQWSEDTDFETLLSEGDDHERAGLPVLPGDGVTVSPETSRQKMIGISRSFERRALREGGGRLVSGFQTLATLRKSDRTHSVYTRLANAGVDVTVCGTPDEQLEEPPFDVFEDTEEQYREYWFLLYDGNGNDSRKAALVSEEQQPSMYDSFWTDDPATVDDLFALARSEYSALF
jgi:hypothetical protein